MTNRRNADTSWGGLTDTSKLLPKLEEENRALREILDPLRDHVRAHLRKKAIQLKQTDGEGWAVGEMLERACIFLDAEVVEAARREGRLWT